MKFLVDESVEYRLVLFLRELSFDVVSVAEDFPAMRDEVILQWANKRKRVLITNDKVFGELIFHQGMDHCGVLLLRIDREDIKFKMSRLEKLLRQHRDNLENNFTVVTEKRVRVRMKGGRVRG